MLNIPTLPQKMSYHWKLLYLETAPEIENQWQNVVNNKTFINSRFSESTVFKRPTDSQITLHRYCYKVPNYNETKRGVRISESLIQGDERWVCTVDSSLSMYDAMTNKILTVQY